jgi:hypothetical protein
MSAPVPPAGTQWLATAILTDATADPGSVARQWLFDGVKADRDGPLARQLLALVADARPVVRRRALALLTELNDRDRVWPAAATAAERALGDPDAPVRRAAAWLLMRAGGLDPSVAALVASADPVARVALVEAMSWAALARRDGVRWSPAVRRLRSDRLPAVRLLADVEALRCAEASQWPALEAAIRAGLDAVDGVLGAPGSEVPRSAGELWASALVHLDREQDCCSWAERLLGPAETPAVRRAGMALAVEAMRTWRAAPARLAPVLAPILAEEPTPVRTAAARALAASTTATRLAADRLITVLDEPDLGDPVAVALGWIGDQRAAPHLARMMRAGRREPGLGQALTLLAPDSAELVAAARLLLSDHPDPCPLPWWECKVEPAMGVLRAAGPAAAGAVPELTARVRSGMDRGDLAGVTHEIGVLGRIGAPARTAVPLLRRYAATGTSSADLAVSALLAITGERAVADRHLAELSEQPRRHRIAPTLLRWLLDNGGLTDRQHRQLRHLFAQPGHMQLATAELLWRCEGPAAAPDVLAELPQYLHDDLDAVRVLRLFEAMGESARPVLGLLESLIRSRRREAFYLSDPDSIMRADEALLAAAVRARDAVAGADSHDQ